MKKIKNIISEIWAPLPGTQDWGAYILELNIRRIPYIAAIVSIFQLADLIIARITSQRLPAWGFALLLSLSVIYGFVAFLIPFRIIARPKAARFFYLSFWVSLYIGYIPFFVRDIMQGEQLINVVLFFSSLVIVPMFTKTERTVLALLFTAATLVIALIYGASVSHLIFLVLLGFSVGLLSYAVQGRSLTFLKGLLYEAYCDVLTGVLNRRGGLNNVKKMLDAAKLQTDTLAFFMVDIDSFKSVNDAYGHHKGDEVLVLVANTLKLLFNAPGDVICRIGGEEFLVCIQVKDRESASEYAENLLRKIEAQHVPTPRQDASQYLTVSVGVRVYTPESPDDSVDELSLIDDADTALYRAKGGGRNRYEMY